MVVIRPKPSKIARKWRLVQLPNPKGGQVGLPRVSHVIPRRTTWVGLQRAPYSALLSSSSRQSTLHHDQINAKTNKFVRKCSAIQLGSQFGSECDSLRPKRLKQALSIISPCGAQCLRNVEWLEPNENHLVSKCKWKLNEEVVSIWELSPAAPIV